MPLQAETKSMNIMDKERLLDILKSKIEEADAIVVGGASGVSAASGFRFYYQDDEVFRQCPVR